MKIIVPMAGIGSRLRPHTLTTPKPLTIIAGKSIVQRLLEEITQVVNQPIQEIIFIIGPVKKGFPSETKNKLKEIANKLGALSSVYVQEEALGTAHAIYCAKESIEGSCVIAFADTLFKADFKLDTNSDGAVWVKKVKNTSSFGVVKLQDGFITDFVEKPKEFISDLAIIGIYYFKESKYLIDEISFLIKNDIRPTGEYQMTEALENLKEKGFKFVPGKVETWMDCGNKNNTVDTNKKILEFEKQKNINLISNDIEMSNSKIIEPCYIGKNVKLKNSEIGPYVSIGDNSIVSNSHIINSLIQTNVQISNAKLDNAMIGHFVKYNQKYTSLSIGDYTELI